MSNIHDTTHLVIQGHEGWMEFRSSHGHHGSPVEVLFKWGDRMKSDGLCKKKLLKAYMIDPNGNKTDLSVEDHDETSYKLSFTPESAGLYRAAVVVDGVTTVTVDGQYLDIPKKECEFPLNRLLLPSMQVLSYLWGITRKGMSMLWVAIWNYCLLIGNPGELGIPLN